MRPDTLDELADIGSRGDLTGARPNPTLTLDHDTLHGRPDQKVYLAWRADNADTITLLLPMRNERLGPVPLAGAVEITIDVIDEDIVVIAEGNGAPVTRVCRLIVDIASLWDIADLRSIHLGELR